MLQRLFSSSTAMSEASSSNAQSSSSQTFLTALVTNAAILGVELVAFIVLKHKLTRIYEPRSYLPPPEYVLASFQSSLCILISVRCSKRASVLPNGPWRWLFAIIAIPTQDVVRRCPLVSFASHHSLCLRSCTKMDWTHTCFYASSGCSSSCSRGSRC